jgi:hypothetical protein
MPHLHLPAEHETTDLVLAHHIARAVDSQELYVSWSHGAGAGQRPEVHARVREAPSAMTEVLTILMGWLSTVVDAFVASGLARRPPQVEPPQGEDSPRVPTGQ